VGIKDHAEQEMETEKENVSRNAKEDATRFRDYAAECRRLAERASEKDRKVLMEIADAWIACAEEAERKQNRRKDS
jgi:hypothetical protein